jgi:hypothetical protein
LINGRASKFFKPTRGLKQGCPMSPLLFLLAVDGLTRIVDAYKRNGKLKGVQIGRGLPSFHLLFVDDVLFGAGSIREAGYVKKELELYKLATGTEVNMTKPSISFFGLYEKVEKRVTG